jgi:hemolysin III
MHVNPLPFPKPPKPTLRGVSHHAAALVALGAGLVLVVLAPPGRATLASAVYSASLVMMFSVSALYHRPTWRPTARQWMKKLDHAAIFLLIAGTFTPFGLLALEGDEAREMLWVAWGGALLGVLQAVFWVRAPRGLKVMLYLALGWAVAPYVPALLEAMGPGGLLLLGAGGLAYSGGALIYALRRPNPLPAVFGYHEIFHVLVILASACHFIAVLEVVRAST